LSVTVSFITGISAVTGLLLTVLLSIAGLLLLLTVLLCITGLLLLLTVLLSIAGLLLLLTVLLSIAGLLLSISLPRRTLLAVLLAVLLAIGSVILCHAGEASIVILADRTSCSHED
jgi:hypothetical protein